MSLIGYGSFSQTVQDEIDDAWNDGAVLVASAGNSPSNNPPSTGADYPAAYSHVIAVAALDSSDTLAAFSYYGSNVHVAAPGVNIYSAGKSDTSQNPVVHDVYYMDSGTSMAAPHVSGQAALMWAQNPSLTNTQISDFIKSTVDGYTPYVTGTPPNQITRTISSTGGKINVYKGVVAATGKIKGVADFNNDADPDFVFETNFQPVYWYTDTISSTTTNISGRAMTSTALTSGWRVSGTGYFNNDSSLDLVLTHPTDTKVHIWFMNGTTRSSGEYIRRYDTLANVNLLQANTFIGTGDFFGDGYSDIVFLDSANSKVHIWDVTDGALWQDGFYVSQTIPSGWSVVGIGDFGDTDPSLLLIGPNREVHIWFLDGTTYAGGRTILIPSSTNPKLLPDGFSVVGLANFDGGGFDEIVMQNDKGEIKYWRVVYNSGSGGQYYFDAEILPKPPL